MEVKTIVLWVLGTCLSLVILILDVDLTILSELANSDLHEIVSVSKAQAVSRKEASAKNKADCEAWCTSHAECEKCSTNRFCGVGYSPLKTWGGKGRNWTACEAPNKVECYKWCLAHKDCVMCKTTLGCGVGYRHLKSFTKGGRNWHACKGAHPGEEDQCCGGRDLLNCSRPWPTGFIGGTNVPKWNEIFHNACVRHDYCYLYGAETYGKSRKDCDQDLKNDLQEICERTFGNSSQMASCLKRKYEYYLGVKLVGGRFFNKTHPDPQVCQYPDRMTTESERKNIGQCSRESRVLAKVKTTDELSGLWVKIQNKGSGKCLDVENESEENGANIQQWGCKDGPNQLFTFVLNEDESINIQNQGSGLCLDVRDAGKNNGANVQQWGCKHGYNQGFRLDVRDGEWFNIRNEDSGKCLDVANESKENGANIQQWGCKDGPNQLFKIVGD